ncbi:MAG TPA: Rrf2 family transcriptional regulator [Ruminococcaceae bacterium]|jgi:Rrf2 family protein|nr:Rrf2 family transcriptional regulator [Oscillospiraceae bacterium]HCM22832.1 Rrf2 family transcriptional regulator [Oscillospiraceae bacterium]
MKLSTRSRYALEGMLYLAAFGQDRPVPVKEVAEGTCISMAYLEQIFFMLKKSGITSTVRGSHGGCVPAKPLNEITAGMIVRAIDGAISPVICVENPEQCDNRPSTCSTRPLWMKITKAITETLDNITLEDLKNGFLKEREAQQQP